MATDDTSRDDWLIRGATDPGEVASRYDQWAEGYDDDLASWSYQAPAVVAETVVTRQPDARSVLDVGCGTGLVGKALRARGYVGRLAGLDISQASLRVARQTGVYDRLETADLQQPLDVEDDSVDVVVCAGVMTYLPDVEAAWREFGRVVRPGGLIVATQREDLWEPRRCQQIIDQLATDGVWTPLDVNGPAPYLPHASAGMAEQGCYYLTARITDPKRAKDELMELTSTDLAHLRRCVDLARQALADGDDPFASVLVGPDGAVLREDHNRTSGGDQTRHPEFALARWAATHVAAEVRPACTVYTSGEHCPMCAAAHAWVGLGRIVYAASTAQLTEWRRGWGCPAPAVAPLPIKAVAPGLMIAGPAPELADELRSLHQQHAEREVAS